MSAADYTKLSGIAAGAEVNVNPDWNATSGDAQILNKPIITNPPATSAANDFQLGSGTGAWIKKTLAETVAILRASLDSVYALAAKGVTNGDTHDHLGGDGGTIAHGSLSGIGTNTHAQIDAHLALPRRERLVEPRTYYVRADGNDSNNGLSNNSSGAFRNIQRAIQTAAELDFSVFDVTIQVADGTYTEPTTIFSWLGTGPLTIQGNAANPGNVIISTTSNHCFNIIGSLPRELTIKDMKLQTSTSGVGFRHFGLGTLNFQNIIFGACASQHIFAGVSGARVLATGAYSIVGNTGYHVLCNSGGNFTCAQTVTLTGTPAFTAFCWATRLSMLVWAGSSFSGSATGSRYAADLNGVIYTNGQATTWLPGNAAGSTAAGGQYV